MNRRKLLYAASIIIVAVLVRFFIESPFFPPKDSVIKALLKKEYTQQNQYDGSELATIEDLKILSKELHVYDKICIVKYHIHCTYMPAAMPPGYERNRPDINEDRITVFQFNHHWQSADQNQ